MDLYLIDGHSYFYRAFHAIRDLSNSKGFPTNAIYGFTNMLMKLLREKKPHALAIVLDSPVPTERHRIYEHYKAQRPETPAALVMQIPHMKKIIEAFRITFFEIPGVEADDVLGTLAKKAAVQGFDVFIVSGDKDMMQIVEKTVKIYDPMKEAIIGQAEVIERFGVPPSRVAEVMALTGDAVDNIPGVKGIGEKTAKDLITSVHNLKDLIEHPERIRSDRVRKMITDNIDSIKLSEILATIDIDLKIEVDMQQLSVKEPDWPALLRIFSDFEFTSLVKMVPSSGWPQRASYMTISDAHALRNYLGLNQ
ncbi:MAG TPA: 5'-3' exonuclease H3TH domain-containing protein [Dissulfurispiraceae bacterium]|nr:5'-3' exonuclease H3TH domain-containing protein [Dissulfurispiraceae bacterium]